MLDVSDVVDDEGVELGEPFDEAVELDAIPNTATEMTTVFFIGFPLMLPTDVNTSEL
jgi:hypothetical protein